MTMLKNTDKSQQLTFGDHACLLYSNMDDYRHIAVHYIIEGLIHDEKVLCIIDEYPKALLLEDLEKKNIDTHKSLASGQLIINNVKNVYQNPAGFNPYKTLEYWNEQLQMIKREKFHGFRVLAEMIFAADGTEKTLHALMEYEMLSNTHSMHFYDNHLYLCVFDKRKFPIFILEDMIKKHTAIINGIELIKPNPYYVNIKEQLREHAERISLRKHFTLETGTDHESTDAKPFKKNKDMEILRYVLSATGDGIWEWNIETNEVYFSKAFFNILGYGEDETIKDCSELVKLIHPKDVSEFIGIIYKCCRNEVHRFSHEVRFKKKIGEYAWLRVKGVSIQKDIGSGKLLSMVGVINDVTEKKKIKRELDEKIYLEKLRTDFFANLSHELRTPINIILGSLQLQELHINADKYSECIDKYKKTQKRMKQNCYRLLRIVNNLIDITRIDAGFYTPNFKNFDIVKLIKDIVLSVEDYIKNTGLSIKFHTNINRLIIACDPEKIERIILNLLSNAVKFTESGGKINVKISVDNNEVIIAIKDSGIGIPQEKLDDIFNRFSQVDKSLSRNHEGSGIGLALVKSLVEMHGGRISAKSQLNNGSQFTISLPIRLVSQQRSLQEAKTIGETNVERIHIEFSDIYF
ncbi:ATP-binding protein [Clostridium formicaceticum]|uniref:histidine kinase n=1 Tax=Clostridium formicaceticum TaxID=1497 RepID=A0AAC9RK47_9CLOT|nr:ATP-binding protein [Clostridium formicaceticum]AOY77024.1 hypothetical protein BJL90_14890 [Clostridium formicaceticum]ARE87521.1 Alkaline phosphatase synthesis sensor protein PhoR [Clostridium formicaceticum]